MKAMQLLKKTQINEKIRQQNSDSGRRQYSTITNR
jgi:hypothetical protein